MTTDPANNAPPAPAPADGGNASPPPAPNSAAPPSPPADGGNAAPSTPASPPWAAQGMYNLGDKPWFETIPEEPVRELMRTKAYENPNVLAVAYANLLKLQNGNPDVVALPKDPNDKAAMDAYYKKMGRPDTADGYDFKIGDDVKVDENLVSSAKQWFHSIGMSAENAQKMVGFWNDYVKGASTAHAEAERVANEQALASLETKWGANLNQHKAEGLRALTSLKQNGLSEEVISKVEASIGAAGVVELMAILGKMGSEGKLFNTSVNSDPNDPANMSQAQISAKIAELRADPAYTDASNPSHKDKVKQMERYFMYAK